MHSYTCTYNQFRFKVFIPVCYSICVFPASCFFILVLKNRLRKKIKIKFEYSNYMYMQKKKSCVSINISSFVKHYCVLIPVQTVTHLSCHNYLFQPRRDVSLQSYSTRVPKGNSDRLYNVSKCIHVNLLKCLFSLVSTDSQSIITCACKAAAYTYTLYFLWIIR